MVLPTRHLLLLSALLALPSSQTYAAGQQITTASSSTGANTTSDVISTALKAGDLVGWFDCATFTFADEREYARNTTTTTSSAAQCAQYKAPLCYAGICEDSKNRVIDVFFKRIQAKEDPESKPNVWFLQGGPGAASPTMELAMTSLYEELKGNVNVYTMDHRGTGRSTLLDCVAAQATTSASPSEGDIDVKEVSSCAEELEIKFGKDLSAFSITSAATDIKTFITQFMAGSKTFVYGVSYGSALVERLMHLQTTEIVGYILDGVSTTSGADAKDGMYITNWDTNFGEVGDRFLAFCASYATCASRFSSLSIQDTLKKLSATNNGPCTSFSTYDQITSLRALVGIMLMSAQARSLIAPLLYRLNRCDYALLDSAVRYSLVRDDSPLNQASEEAAFTSTLLYYLIVFSEMWETPTPSYSTLQSRFDNVSISSGPISAMHAQYCAFTKDNSTGCAKPTLYAASPIAYKKDKYWNVAATIPAQASVLIMSGKLDPQTPHKYAERLFKVLNGTKKELVTFEYASHGTLFSTYVSDAAAASGTPTCGMSVLASYVANVGDLTKLDTSCVASLQLHFEPSPAVSKMLFHTLDAYDGEFVFDEEGDDYNYETKYKYRTPFIVMVIALAVLLLIAAGLCFRCHRRKSAEKAKATSATTTRTDRSEHGSANATERMDLDVAASPSATAGVYTAVEESRV